MYNRFGRKNVVPIHEKANIEKKSKKEKKKTQLKNRKMLCA